MYYIDFLSKQKNDLKKLMLNSNLDTRYLDIIDEFLENEFISNNNKNYLRKTKANVLKAQKIKNIIKKIR